MATAADPEVSISRRTVLKGIGAGIGAALLLPSGELYAKTGGNRGPKHRAFVYLDHAGRDSWVIAGALYLDARRPRQMLRRAKRARLPQEWRSIPQLKAAFAPPAVADYLYGLLAREGALRRNERRGVEIFSIHLDGPQLRLIARENRGHVHLLMVQTLLKAMHLSRFHEVFVYYNLPAVSRVSRRSYREGIQAMAGRGGHGVLGAYLRRPLLNHGHRGLFSQHVPNEHHFPDDAIQVSDFIAQAFLQKAATALGPVVRADINAAMVDEIIALTA